MAREHDSMNPMNNDTIGRALREALDVTPSPDFVARVRTRIASEPVPRSLWSRWTVWMPVTVGAVAAAIALAVWIGRPVNVPLRSDQTVRLKPDTTPVTTATPTVRLPAPSVREGKADATPVTTATATTATATTPTPPYVVSGFPSLGLGTGRRTVVSRKEPEILISQGESVALRLLMVRASEGQIVVNGPSASPSDSGPDPSDGVQPLPEIQPLKIDPVVPVNGEEGVRQ